MTKHFAGILLVALFMALTGCVDSEEHNALKKDYEIIKSENVELKNQLKSLSKEIDELKNGAERLLAQGKNLFNSSKYDDAFDMFQGLISKHPEAGEAKEAQSYLAKIDTIKKKELAEKVRKNKEEENRLKMSLSAMETETDKVEGITWYRPLKALKWHKSIKMYGGVEAPIFLYVGKSANNTWIRLKALYKASDWLFVEKVIAFVDGTKYTISTDEFKRDNNGDGIWEWSDISPDKSDLNIIERIINSKETIIRFYGDTYHRDREMKKRHKEALQNSLDAYKLLSRKS